jgi:hypothetical protein
MHRRAISAAVILGALAPATAGAAPVAWTGVPSANPKVAGTSFDNRLSPELTESAVARGAMPLDGASSAIPYFGYDAFTAPTVLTQSTDEAHKTEPDKNTYLKLARGQAGPDPSYDYGTHFVYQGHESGPGYITRVNLDADEQHRVTLLATTDENDTNLPAFDGSTWDPWAQRLLLTAELGSNGGVWAATLGYPSHVTDISGALGRGGYEGIQNDSAGNLVIVEDSGGTTGSTAAGLNHARQPNSFVYRFRPTTPSDLSRGKLQVLQVISARTGQPITFHTGQADADIKSDDTLDLHTYGHELRTRWVTIHDTATDGTTPFGANALAKAKGGTPFKRPENGQFVPGSNFKSFVFDETGDTNLLTEAGSDYGGFGTVQKLTQSSPTANTGTIRVVYQSDPAHAGFDNVTFVDQHHAAFVEDAGDTLHTQRNALDSGYLLDVTADYSKASTPAPTRFLAEGRDPSATFDAEHTTGNDGDNEITGIHASDGDPSIGGILGAKTPSLFQNGWRLFWTQQHGDNNLWEVTPSR